MADSWVGEDEAFSEDTSQDDLVLQGNSDVLSLEQLCALLKEGGDVVIKTSHPAIIDCTSLGDSSTPPDGVRVVSPFGELVQLSINDAEFHTVEEESLSTETKTSSCQEPTASFLQNNVSDTEQQTSSRKRGRVNVDKRTWSAEVTKAKRLKGEAYIGYKREDKKKTKMIRDNIEKQAVRIGERCMSQRCKNIKTRHCDEIDEETRKMLFKTFWGYSDWKEKKVFLATLVHSHKPKQSSKKAKKKREVTYIYHLRGKNENLLPVCRTMFLNTFGLTYERVRHWLEAFFPKTKSSEPHVDSELTQENDVEVSDPRTSAVEDDASFIAPYTSSLLSERIKYLENFLTNAPKLPSHYCRKSTSKLYLQTDITSMTDFFKLYISKSAKDGFKPLSRWKFDMECKRKNIDIYIPKKDLCDLCFKHKKNNIHDEVYLAHIQLKDSARDEKNKDKQLGKENKLWVLECDVMAVKLLPFIQASASYYKMKLAIHNYTIYNLENHDAICLWFTENEGDLSASSFASLLVQEIERLIDQEKRDVVVYSDGCTNQNRNCIMSNALLSLAMTKGVFIYQKYLEKGHTQMEGDSVHSVIEGAMRKGEFFLPHELVSLTKRARGVPMPYRSRLVYHNEFKDFSKPIRYHSIRPGNKPQDPCVTDIRVLQYDPSGVIRYKLKFTDEFEQLPRRPKPVDYTAGFPPLHIKPLPIPKDKWDDLQYLKPWMPSESHDYYDKLPHASESIRKAKRSTKQAEVTENQD